jgi:hypothetical protein
MKSLEPLENCSATYSPEDNKLRLYVGRVPREEYLALRSAGWTSTPKQDCDFVSTWTPTRRDTALEYAGIIGDEDQSPAERAADRAERFSGYRDKRTNDATTNADRYDAQPMAHGYQNAQRAERSAARHDRIAAKAGDFWSKAEYWQRRTAGVISNAIYKSTPGVRMGRIKIIESDLRRESLCPEWRAHLELRLAYENQMCEAAGGRAALVEMVPGGFIGSHQIRKVCKSPVTGQVVSVEVMGTHSGYTRESNYKEYKTQACPILFNIERLKADVYRAPTPEELEVYNAARKAEKAARPKVEKPPLINPTDADAEKLQAIWNARTKSEYDASMLRQYGTPLSDSDFKLSTVCRVTQAVYSSHSKGSYASAKTRGIGAGGELKGTHYNAKPIKEFCELRTTGSDGNTYGAKRIIVLTDKPQKPLPAEVWLELPPVEEKQESTGYAGKDSRGLSYSVNG